MLFESAFVALLASFASANSSSIWSTTDRVITTSQWITSDRVITTSAPWTTTRDWETTDRIITSSTWSTTDRVITTSTWGTTDRVVTTSTWGTTDRIITTSTWGTTDRVIATSKTLVTPIPEVTKTTYTPIPEITTSKFTTYTIHPNATKSTGGDSLTNNFKGTAVGANIASSSVASDAPLSSQNSAAQRQILNAPAFQALILGLILFCGLASSTVLLS